MINILYWFVNKILMYLFYYYIEKYIKILLLIIYWYINYFNELYKKRLFFERFY